MPTPTDALRILEVDTHSGQRVASDGSIVNEADTIDPSVDAVSTVTETQAAIHRKHAFSISERGDIPQASSLFIYLRTGAIPVHFMDMDLTFETGNELITLYEGPTILADGTPLTTVAMNRVPPLAVPLSTLFTAPTISGVAYGSQLAVAEVFPTNKTVAPVSFAGGRVLAANTKYLFKIDNLTANAAVGYTLSMSFHES